MNDIAEKAGSFIVAYSFSDEKTGVVVVGEKDGKEMKVINAFQGSDAADIYKLLKNKEDSSDGNSDQM